MLCVAQTISFPFHPWHPVNKAVMLHLLLLLLLSSMLLTSRGQQDHSDHFNNDMLLNAIHSNETPIINDAITELR